MAIVRTKLNYIPGVLVLIGLVLLLWNLPPVLRGQANPRTAAPAQAQTAPAPADVTRRVGDLENQIAQLTKARDALQDRLDSIIRDANAAQWLLAMVLAAAGLLTLAQGVLAFFNAQTYVKQADDAIQRANEAVGKADEAKQTAIQKTNEVIAVMDGLAAEVRTKFPVFTDIESARVDAFRELSSLIPLLDTDQNLYLQCAPLMRQKLFSIESFSAIQFLTPTNRNAELLHHLRLLGKFYAGKFLAEHRAPLDFERSRYYFDLALARFDRPFSVLNDLGWLFSSVADPVDLPQARAHFEESIQRRPNQQRAPFNLGTLSYERRNRDRLAAALNLLRRAANEVNWEETTNTQMAAHISYNLACTYDALAELDPAAMQNILDECSQYLILAAGIGSQTRETVEADLAFGDLRFLGRSDRHRDQVRRALALYRAAWAVRYSTAV